MGATIITFPLLNIDDIILNGAVGCISRSGFRFWVDPDFCDAAPLKNRFIIQTFAGSPFFSSLIEKGTF
jgi:hypothetical protein